MNATRFRLSLGAPRHAQAIARDSQRSPLDPWSLGLLLIALTLATLPTILRVGLGIGSIFIGGLVVRVACLWLRRAPPGETWLVAPVFAMVPFAVQGWLEQRPDWLVAGAALVFLGFAAGLAMVARVRRDTTLATAITLPLMLPLLVASQRVETMSYVFAVLLIAVLAQANAFRRGDSARTAADVARSGGAVARLLLASLPVIALLFLLFPRMPVGFFAGSRSAGSAGMATTLNPAQIEGQTLSDAAVFRAVFGVKDPGDAADIAPPDLYWRTVVLEVFDGTTWREAPGSVEQLPPVTPAEPAAQPAAAIGYLLDLEPQRGLPLPTWDHTQGRITLYGNGGALPYQSRADGTRVLLASYPDNIRLRGHGYAAILRGQTGPQELARNLALPTDSNPRTVAAGRALAAEGLAPEVIVQRLLDRFRAAPFRYTLQPGRLSGHWIDQFLFSTQAGFCEHYAAAFALLARAAGVPTRVVGGYKGGEPISKGTLLIRQRDAHAWAEVWLGDRGWVRVDPTSYIDPSRVERDGNYDSASLTAGGGIGGQLRALLARANRAWNDTVLHYDMMDQFHLLSRLHIPQRYQFAGILLIAVVLWWASRRTAAWWRRRQAWQALAPRAQALAGVDVQLRRLELHRRPEETPRQWLERARAGLTPTSGAQLAAIVQRYELLTYGCCAVDEERRMLAELQQRAQKFRPVACTTSTPMRETATSLA